MQSDSLNKVMTTAEQLAAQCHPHLPKWVCPQHKRMTGVFNSLVEAGIDCSLPLEEAKHVRFLNMWGIALVGLTLFFCLFFYAIGIYFMSFYLTMFMVVYLLTFWISTRGKHFLARFLGFVMGHIVWLFLVLALKQHHLMSGDAQYFVLLFMLEAFILFPKSENIFLHLINFISAVSFSWTFLMINPITTIVNKWQRVTETLIVFGILIAFMSMGYIFRSIWLKSEAMLKEERDRSEQLLLNIFPAPVVKELKEGKAFIAESFPEVTVLFADISGFTPLAEQMPPTQVVDLLNKVFTSFDTLVERYGLEKIKTIGDAYMVAGGLSQARKDHKQAMADLALDLRRSAAELSNLNGHNIELRIGISAGPAVAGVIGMKKFSYDLWSDTVNLASRMESHGVPGRIQVPDPLYQSLKEEYLFSERGLVEIKGKGTLKTYFLEGKKNGNN